MATRLQAASEVVKDLIKKSQLISSPSEDPPARYRLLTTRTDLNESGSVRKWTFGQQDRNMQNKILLMVGETGTGKTSLINAMTNHILGVKFTDEVWFEITEEGGDKLKSYQSQSQTSNITVYEVFAIDNPICLTIIDTPGYGDIRGTDVDKGIAENLYKLFHSDAGVKEIDAVCLVMKASIYRLSDRQQYILDAVLSLFGKDIENNIVMLITYSDGMPPGDAFNVIKQAGILCRKDENDEPEHFLFNNRQTDKRSKNYNRALRTAWELTEESLNELFGSLKEENRKSFEQTEEVHKESKQLVACINNLQNCIYFVECKGKELAEIQKALEENREKIKSNENFSFKVTKYYKEKVDIVNVAWKDRKATTCSVCQENCHEYDYWRALNARWCKNMKKGHCTVCTGKCHHSKHIRENKKYVTRSKVETVTHDDVKKQYEDNKEQEAKNKSIEEALKEDIDKWEKKKTEHVEEACTSIIKLSEIALKPVSAFIVKTLDFWIPQAEKNGKHFFVQKLKKLRNIQSESQKRVDAAISYARAGSS